MDPHQIVLNKFVGSWTSQVTVKSPEGEVTYTSNTTFKWVLGGQFLQDTGESPDSDNEHIGYWSYDDPTDTFRSSYFLHPAGNTMQFTNRWDEANQQMTGQTDLGGGLTLTTCDTFKGEDQYHWTATMLGGGGNVMVEMLGSCKRVY